MTIGIDLGTTNTVLSKLSSTNNYPNIIPIDNHKLTPSVVHFKNNNFTVGNSAMKFLKSDPKNTIYSVKSLIGRRIYELRKNFPYKITENVDIEIDGKKFTPEEISSKILKKIKKGNIAKTDTVVLTIPARFNETQRRATKRAADLAGIKVDRLLNEPTAAALSFGISGKKDGLYVVYDLGGGTFDISVLEVRNGVFEVLSTGGCTNLGGDDFDYAIAENIISDLEEKGNLKLIAKEKTELRHALKPVGEDMKRRINNVDGNISCEIEHEILKRHHANNFIYKLCKKKFMRLINPLVDRTMRITQRTIDEANIDIPDINRVLLVGGMSKLNYIQQRLELLFNKKPDLSIDPDLAVAKGAALQAGIIRGTISDALLLDISSHSLGIETFGGFFNKMIGKNESLPATHYEEFTTAEDNQETVDINIYQGEDSLVKNNHFLGKFQLKNIEKEKKGIPRIGVSFQADTNGLIKVEAVDKLTGSAKNIEIINKI